MKFLNKLFVYIKENILLQFIGFLLVLSFIWFRFIYKRLPKDIPFNLSLISLLGLITICIIYIIIIYKLFKPTLSSDWKSILYPIAKWLIKPLLQINQLLLSKKKIQQVIKILLYLLYKSLKKYAINHYRVNIHAFLTIMPQIIFTVCLIIDCFYFKQLYLMYACVFIITYPLIAQYLIYVSEIIRMYDVEILDKYFIIEITSEDIVYPEDAWDKEGFLKPGYPTYFCDPSHLEYDSIFDFYDKKDYKYLKILNFIEAQNSNLVCNDLLYEYKILFQHERKDILFLENLILPPNLNKHICDNLLQFYINISVLKDNIRFAKKHFSNYYLNLHILINIIILICWIYILIVSIHTFHFTDFDIRYLENFQDIYEPFSNLILNISHET